MMSHTVIHFCIPLLVVMVAAVMEVANICITSMLSWKLLVLIFIVAEATDARRKKHQL